MGGKAVCPEGAAARRPNRVVFFVAAAQGVSQLLGQGGLTLSTALQVIVIHPIIQMRKLRLRQANWDARSHTARM